MIGSGILTLPWATAQVGLVLSSVGLLVMAYLTQEAIRFAARCVAHIERAHAAPDPRTADDEESTSSLVPSGSGEGASWKRISHAAFGRSGAAITLGSLVLAQIGASASYFAYVSISLAKHVPGLSLPAAEAITAVALSALCMTRTLRSVALLSMAGLVAYCYILVLIVYYGAQQPLPAEAPLLFDASAFGLWFS